MWRVRYCPQPCWAVIMAADAFSRPDALLDAVAYAAIAVFAGLAFIRRQQRAPQPLLPLTLFAEPRFSTGGADLHWLRLSVRGSPSSYCLFIPERVWLQCIYRRTAVHRLAGGDHPRRAACRTAGGSLCSRNHLDCRFMPVRRRAAAAGPAARSGADVGYQLARAGLRYRFWLFSKPE